MDIMQSLERLHRECIDSSSNEASDEASQLMVAAASILHEHHEKELSVYRGSMKGLQGNMTGKRVDGHARRYKDYFHLTGSMYKPDVKRPVDGHSTGASETTAPTSNARPVLVS
jgi:hypothetical protein